MKVRSDDELIDTITGFFTWRILDISRLRQSILSTKKNHLKFQTLLRASIPMLYAHWEGFIKEAATAYYTYISTKKLMFKELQQGMLSKYIENEFINKSYSTVDMSFDIVHFFSNSLDQRSNNNKVPEPINTRSNLNSTVLREILLILGLDYEKFRGYEVFIDSKLLNARNKIAHGEYKTIEYEFYDEMHQFVITAMRTFKDEIENNAVQKKYKKTLVA